MKFEQMQRVHELRRLILIAQFQRDTFGPGADFEDPGDDPASYVQRLEELQKELAELTGKQQ